MAWNIDVYPMIYVPENAHTIDEKSIDTQRRETVYFGNIRGLDTSVHVARHGVCGDTLSCVCTCSFNQ